MSIIQESTVQSKAAAIIENAGKVMIGKKEVMTLVMTAILADGHVLLEDVPGTGKTVMAKAFAKSIASSFARIQFTPDLLPSDVTGIHYYNQKQGEFVLRKGPVFANIILADEINRATPRTQSSLLECMEERQVTIDGQTHLLEKPFLVIATQNPVETAGTFRLPEAQLDRFLMQIAMGYPDQAEEVEMIDRFLMDSPLEELQAVCSSDELMQMQAEARSVYIHPSLKQYIVNIADATRSLPEVSIGVSPRGILTMVRAVRAYAYIMGRDYVVPEDIAVLSVPVFAHRLVCKLGMIAGSSNEELVRKAVSSCQVPTESWNQAAG